MRAKNGDTVYLLLDSNVSWNDNGTFNHTRCFLRNDAERRIREAIKEENIKRAALISAAKDRFIRKIFHEIKTPLHTLSSSLQINLIQDSNEFNALCDQVTIFKKYFLFIYFIYLFMFYL
jgi:signal transduction histidine kinase